MIPNHVSNLSSLCLLNNWKIRDLGNKKEKKKISPDCVEQWNWEQKGKCYGEVKLRRRLQIQERLGEEEIAGLRTKGWCVVFFSVLCLFFGAGPYFSLFCIFFF